MTSSLDTQINRSLYQAIHAISSMIEARDPYTFMHQDGVSELARQIGQAMGLSQNTIECLRICGTLHDIGKISIPAEILGMPRALTEEEFSLVRTHPLVGYNILKDVEFPWPVADIICQHHERLDGSGYPNRLKAEEILLEAKIIAVADAFESMVVDRPYRRQLSVDFSISELQSQGGALYDQDVVNALISLIEESRQSSGKSREHLPPVIQAIIKT